MHKYGTPASGMEQHLSDVSTTLGVKGQFLVTPTTLTFVLFDDESDQEFNYILRVRPGEIDLGMLTRTQQLVDRVVLGELDLFQAISTLDENEQKPDLSSGPLTLLAYVVTGAAFAMLMNANWITIAISGLLSIIGFSLVWQARTRPRIASAIEPLSAALSAIGAYALAFIFPSLDINLTVLSSIIIFIPGLSLTLGLNELASRELISGTARIMDSFMTLFKLYFGAILGLEIAKQALGIPLLISDVQHLWWLNWLGVILLSLGLTVIFKVRKAELVWGVLSGVIAYGASVIGAVYIGAGLGPFVGAFVVGVYANVFAHVRKIPASVVLLQGIVLLVPGSKAYISLSNTFIQDSFVVNNNMASETFMIFMSIIAGLIFANLASQRRLGL
ncbi:threonine/serine exporter family protein [Alginatibacterium sediminis]|uniref:threonine/serine ThrE exporter family protein n=1 Tax=Alginatibacterium sediminis TaxID=2164068 RepID=UPI001F331491|nr:threonine/serine exporter family protein [Alginatibacterium sediminis]